MALEQPLDVRGSRTYDYKICVNIPTIQETSSWNIKDQRNETHSGDIAREAHELAIKQEFQLHAFHIFTFAYYQLLEMHNNYSRRTD